MTEPEQPLSRRAAREAEAAARRRPSKGSPPERPADEQPLDEQRTVALPAAEQSTALQPTALQPTQVLGATAATELLTAPEVARAEGAGSVAVGAGVTGVGVAGAGVTGAGVANTVATDTVATGTEAKGIGAFVRKHPRAVLTTALSVAFLLLGTGAVLAGISVGSAQAAPVPVPTETQTPEPDPRPLPGAITDPSRLRTCSVAAIARDERLDEFFGSVINASTGEVLWDRQADRAVRTASVLKVITAAAALSALGPDHRMTTRVVTGSTPGTVVLVGGGDATLSRLPAGQESIYRGAPKLSDLAAQTVAAYAAANPDEPGITNLVLDSTFWNPADNWHETWNRDRIAAGYQAPATALMVDGDRNDPRAQTSARSNDPIARAGQWFAQALADAGNPAGVPSITTGAAVGGTTLGQVQSQPVSTLIGQMMPNSDNTIGEMLARVISREIGLNGSTASLTQAITGALNSYGVPTDGLIIKDGSGLATDNAVPARYMAQLFAVINTRERNLGIIMDSLPVAGVSGSLASRFTGPNALARGNVIAKTGWLRSAYTLSGVIRAADGTPLTFAFYSVRTGISESAKAAHDTLAAAMFTCGDNLSNN